MPFWASIGLLSLAQGAIVALPGARWSAARGRGLRSAWWAIVPAGSVIAFVAVGGLAAQQSARALTYVALVCVPVLAAVALGWLARGSRGALAGAVAPLFVLAWLDRSGLAGQGAAVALAGLSCVALGALVAALTPPPWLGLGIVAMALADATLVVADLLQRPNDALNGAHPAAGLPRLQVAIFGSAAMGYGDLFVAGLLGGLLAVTGPRPRQLRGAALVALCALAFDVLFVFVDELPATVPVAGALLVLLWLERRRWPLSRASARASGRRRRHARRTASRSARS